MSEWHGFASMEFLGDCDLRVSADYGGPDEDPTPVMLLHQPSLMPSRPHSEDIIQITEAALRWLVEDVAPTVHNRMEERP